MILAVETATQTLSVALVAGASVLAEISTRDERLHSERLLPAIDELLKRAGVRLEDLTGFAVSAGPGSFTGLRIGIATVKGLAFGRPTPVAAVSTLEALASAARRDSTAVAALLDARRDEVYAAVFAASGGLSGDRVHSAEELAEALPSGCSVVVGEGARGVALRLAELRADVRLLAPPYGEPRAGAVGRLGAAILAAGGGVPAEALLPRYVRRAEAEVRRTGERFEAV